MTTVSAYVPIPGPGDLVVPDTGPSFEMHLQFCSCDVGATQDCVDSNGCAGVQHCKSSSSCIATYLCDDDGSCQTTRDTCEMVCGIQKAACDTTLCGFPPHPCEDCAAELETCMDNCESDYNTCATCGGYWEICLPSNACCGVTCPSNQECDAGACVCSDSTERCGTGTGDGVDNDCDGDTDEGCASCIAGSTQNCIQDGCAGSQTCKPNGEWGLCHKADVCCGVSCAPNKVCDDSSGDCVCADVNELCLRTETGVVGDGVDNDCDGLVDEGCDYSNPPAANASGPGGGGAACPADAKICPDGSTVGRVGPSCEFAQCPTPANVSPGTGGTGGGGIGPGGLGPGTGTAAGQQSGGVDMNLVMILVIVVAAGVIGLIAILLLKRKPPVAVPAQPQVPGA